MAPDIGRYTAGAKKTKQDPMGNRFDSTVNTRLDTPTSARDLVIQFGGDWHGDYGLVPGPGHSPKDRSLKVCEFEGEIRVHSYAGDDWRVCRDHLGLGRSPPCRDPYVARRPPSVARPTRRVRDLLRASTWPGNVEDVIEHLKSRKLWPLPRHCTLRAHIGAAYWQSDGDRLVKVGHYPAMLAPVRDRDGELVTVHSTYLENGRKLARGTPRKLLSPTTGRGGCAVRIMPEGKSLVIAEGIETALAAHRILGVSAWAALNTALLGKFDPPEGVERLIIAADNDRAGLEAARKLLLRLRGRLKVELAVPRRGDFAEDLEAGS